MLESGATLGPVEVQYETYGTLAADGSNAVFVCHALTGDAHAAGHHGDPTRPGWWDTLIGPGKAARHRLAVRHLPQPARRLPGNDRAVVDRPRDRQAVRAAVPPLHGRRPRHRPPAPARAPRDRAAARRDRRLARRHAGAPVGARSPDGDRERRSSSAPRRRLSAQNIAFSAVARASITGDEHFAGGDYYATGEKPRVGLADRADDGAHHLRLRGEPPPQVRPRPDRRGADVRHRLPGRELPRAPGPDIPRPLRRELVPLPHPRDGLLRPVRRRGGRDRAAPRGARRGSSSSRSTPTGASRRPTRPRSPACSRSPAATSRRRRSPRPGATTRSCSRCRATTSSWRRTWERGGRRGAMLYRRRGAGTHRPLGVKRYRRGRRCTAPRRRFA